MIDEKAVLEQIKELENQTALLTKELGRLNAQNSLDIARQTQQTAISNGLLAALKIQKTSEFDDVSATAKAPFAMLAGIKAGLTGMALPTGKDGTVKVQAGVAGTMLLRTKQPLFQLLSETADDLAEAMPSGAVLVTDAILEEARAAAFKRVQIGDLTKSLEDELAPMRPAGAVATFSMLPAAVAGAYGIGMALGVCAADGLLIQRRCEVSRIAESGSENRRFRRVEAAQADLTLRR